MEVQVYGGDKQSARPPRSIPTAMARGLAGRCPRCGTGKLFASFLKPVDHCAVCREPLHYQRADDLPAYLVIVVVGHILVGSFLVLEPSSSLSMWQTFAIWIPLAIVGALALIRPVKGAVIGLQWAAYMHGFGGEDDPVRDI